MTEAETQTIETLLMRNLLEVFGETDAAKRRAVIAEIWAANGVMIAPEGRIVGPDAVDETVGKLHARFPGFVFSPIGQPQAFNGIGRLSWGYGPHGEAPKVTGVDIVIVEDGRIATLLTFLDTKPTE